MYIWVTLHWYWEILASGIYFNLLNVNNSLRFPLIFVVLFWFLCSQHFASVSKTHFLFLLAFVRLPLQSITFSALTIYISVNQCTPFNRCLPYPFMRLKCIKCTYSLSFAILLAMDSAITHKQYQVFTVSGLWMLLQTMSRKGKLESTNSQKLALIMPHYICWRWEGKGW